jgi:4-hydroxy-4-methyl-2-oxoglutarate aldolase
MSTEKMKNEVGMMNLEKLIDARENRKEVKFPVSDDELLKRYEQLYTGAVNDVLREFVRLEQALPSAIRPLERYHPVAGFAFTVKSSPNTKVTGEMEFRSKMLDDMHKNAFVIWDTSNDQNSGVWGGVMTATAKSKKVKATCIDGCIRDTHQIIEADFPMFYKNRTSNGSLGRMLITHYQIALQIGNVFINPGDVVLADIDGVLVIPREIAYDVLLRAEEIKKNEDKIFKWVKEGRSIKQITDDGGYF